MVQPRAGQGAVQIALRLSPDLRDRVKASADRNGRSMNSEIVNCLEAAYPPEPSLEETVEDIQEAVRLLRRFKGKNLLLTLADSLDWLILDISKSTEVSKEDREAAREHINERGRFTRFVPPDGSDS